jgi:hypothetical protein
VAVLASGSIPCASIRADQSTRSFSSVIAPHIVDRDARDRE